MNLIALLIGLVIERLATQLFHWRRMRWMDRIIDAGFSQARRVATWPAIIPVILLAILLVLPVFAIIWFLGDTLAGFTYLLLAIVVLFFSLGPRDIGEEVGAYCKALEEDEPELIHNAAKAIVEGDVPEDVRERTSCVEAAVCVQANNRLFAVVFWFVVLGPFGPLGAWAYRVTDMIRRRAVFNAARDDEPDANAASIRDAAEMLHGWLAWIPARLTAIGYAAAGHMDDALAALRAPRVQIRCRRAKSMRCHRCEAAVPKVGPSRRNPLGTRGLRVRSALLVVDDEHRIDSSSRLDRTSQDPRVRPTGL